MRKINFSANLWLYARTILDVLKVNTNCFDFDGKVIRAKFLVAIDDDPTSALYAAQMYHLIFKEHGYHPLVLCVGGLGLLSKPMNGKGITEGIKLANVSQSFGIEASDIVVLDKGSNTGLNARDIALFQLEYLKKQILEITKGQGIHDDEMAARLSAINKITIFCVTERLSWRLERTVKFLSHQYKQELKVGNSCFEIKDYYYVPNQDWEDMLMYFNGKKFAGGIMLLAEIASIWDRYEKSKGKYMMPLDLKAEKMVRGKIWKIAKKLTQEMPLKIPGFNIRKFWQYPYAYIDVVSHKKLAAADLEQWIEEKKVSIKDNKAVQSRTYYCPCGY